MSIHASKMAVNEKEELLRTKAAEATILNTFTTYDQEIQEIADILGEPYIAGLPGTSTEDKKFYEDAKKFNDSVPDILKLFV